MGSPSLSLPKMAPITSVQLSSWLFVAGSVLFLAKCVCDEGLINREAECRMLSMAKPLSLGSAGYLLGSLLMAWDAHAPPESWPPPELPKDTERRRSAEGVLKE